MLNSSTYYSGNVERLVKTKDETTQHQIFAKMTIGKLILVNVTELASDQSASLIIFSKLVFLLAIDIQNFLFLIKTDLYTISFNIFDVLSSCHRIFAKVILPSFPTLFRVTILKSSPSTFIPLIFPLIHLDTT